LVRRVLPVAVLAKLLNLLLDVAQLLFECVSDAAPELALRREVLRRALPGGPALFWRGHEIEGLIGISARETFLPRGNIFVDEFSLVPAKVGDMVEQTFVLFVVYGLVQLAVVASICDSSGSPEIIVVNSQPLSECAKRLQKVPLRLASEI
jgi:hypothetical protein